MRVCVWCAWKSDYSNHSRLSNIQRTSPALQLQPLQHWMAVLCTSLLHDKIFERRNVLFTNPLWESVRGTRCWSLWLWWSRCKRTARFQTLHWLVFIGTRYDAVKQSNPLCIQGYHAQVHQHFRNECIDEDQPRDIILLEVGALSAPKLQLRTYVFLPLSNMATRLYV